MATKGPPTITAVWVGGTSALARTFLDEVHPKVCHRLRIIVAAPTPPAWNLPPTVEFVKLDLLSEASTATFWQRLPSAVDALILGVRLSLVWAGCRQSALTQHLHQLLLGASMSAAGCRAVLHISSVAVANHVVAQRNVGEDAPLPKLDAYRSDYDRFKRLSEDIVDAACTAAPERMAWTHLRISGIFSNDPACIQCTAVRNQSRVSCYSSTCIDFNSSSNVAHAIALLLPRLAATSAMPSPEGSHPPPERVYYYTRATADPVAYGSLVADYRAAHGIWFALWLPSSLYVGVVGVLRAACERLPWERTRR